MPIVEARGLSFTYAGSQVPAIKDINLKVEEGEFVVLSGPSGCGKTTLCRCFNALIPNFYYGILTGEIYVDGLDIKKSSTAELAKRVGFVFQNPENQLFALSVERDVAFGPENLGLPRDEVRRRVEWALEVTGTKDLRDRPPYELSGGQQQRVAIASVLAMRPKLIVLDEPTSFLDPLSAESIISVISRLNKELGITIILVEHRLDLVSAHADRVIIMDEGKIALDGPPQEVYNEAARLIGVGIPRVTYLFHLLRSEGLRIKDNPVTVEKSAAILGALLKP